MESKKKINVPVSSKMHFGQFTVEVEELHVFISAVFVCVKRVNH